MNLFADESVDRRIVARLRLEGHRVESVAELSPGIPDEEVLRLANDVAFVLITEEEDFGELVFRRHLAHSGILFLRLDGQTGHAKGDIVLRVISDHAEELPGAFTVVTPDTLRICRLP